MRAVLAVALGGAVGAVLRYWTYQLTGHLLGTQFPFGTLTVNVVGSFAMGVLVESLALAWSAPSEVRLFLAVGVLGAFTTFSAFSLDFALLYERGRLDLSALYTALSVACSVGALFAGLHLTRWFLIRPL
jgi:CrcB protein